VLACSLLFALGLSAWADHRRMRPLECLAALATFAGLVVFLSVAQPSGGQQTASSGWLGFSTLAAGLIAVLAGVFSTRLSPLRRALVLGIGGGVAAGATDAVTKTVAALAGVHKLGVLADPRFYMLAAIGLLTYTLQQNGYRTGGLAAFLPVFSVLDPVVGSILGLAIYHEHLDGGAGRMALEAAAVIAACWGITRLASSTADAEPAAQPVVAQPLVAQPVAVQPVAVQPLAARAAARLMRRLRRLPVPIAVPAAMPGKLPALQALAVAKDLPIILEIGLTPAPAPIAAVEDQ
jgi:hypothetical protein